MDEQTIISALSRLEDIAGKYGPVVASGVSGLADMLGGSLPATDGIAAKTGAAIPSTIVTRLHSLADTLQGIFGGIENHTARAKQAVG